jgi:hypothetical protein
MGEYWTQLANLLIESGRLDQIVVAPLAFSGSEVARWGKGGDINALLADTTAQLNGQGYRVSYVVWDQGEVDYVRGTSAETYRERFLSMVDTLREQGVTAHVHVTIASKCLEPSNGGFKTHSQDNAIVRAQIEVSKDGQDIRRGVNTDALLDGVDRYDDCHLAGSGAEKVAQAWANLLLADQPPAQRGPNVSGGENPGPL